jgi:hypothetical protein
MTKKTYDLFASIFAELGLSEVSCGVYQFFLFNPDKSITDCASDLSIHRRQVYEGIAELIKHKLATHQDKKVITEPISALSSLLDYQSLRLNTKAKELKELAPRIEEQTYFMRDSVVQIFSRKKEYLDIYHRIINEANPGSELRGYGVGENFYGLIDFDYFDRNYVPVRLSKDINLKIITCGDLLFGTQERFKDATKKRSVKYLANQYITNSAYWVIEDKVVFWNTQLVRAVVIKDQAVADMMVNTFELAWKIASEVYEKRL